MAGSDKNNIRRKANTVPDDYVEAIDNILDLSGLQANSTGITLKLVAEKNGAVSETLSITITPNEDLQSPTGVEGVDAEDAEA